MRNILSSLYAPDGSLCDIEVTKTDTSRSIRMLGSGGADRELALLAPLDTLKTSCSKLPVLLGSGFGYAIEALLQRLPENIPFAVVDKEEEILKLTHLQKKFDSQRILWITDSDQKKVLKKLTVWQEKHHYAPLLPLIHPFYVRLDREWYQTIRQHLEASSQFDFWGKAIQPRFQSKDVRLLLITSKYFLMGEVVEACKRLNIAHYLLSIEDKEVAKTEFITQLLQAILTFKPDCVLTLNHLGVDREGVLINLLERLQLPIASWFVDNPQLIIHLYKDLISPWTTIFTWDNDNLAELKAQGYQHVFYLPLGTNPNRFRPHQSKLPSSLFPTRISFVGNSMVYKVKKKISKYSYPKILLQTYKTIARDFRASTEKSIRHFILNRKDISATYLALSSNEAKLEYEAMLTWEATLQYRAECVSAILPLHPVIVGDDGWLQIFPKAQPKWYRHPEVAYYNELPCVYPFSDINFNCTSQQMKGAVNQRIFDVPACSAFVLTDWREQMNNLMEPGKEIICFHSNEEAADLARFYLDHPAERQLIAQAGRRRVLAEHTWEKRILTLIDTMKSIYS